MDDSAIEKDNKLNDRKYYLSKKKLEELHVFKNYCVKKFKFKKDFPDNYFIRLITIPKYDFNTNVDRIKHFYDWYTNNDILNFDYKNHPYNSLKFIFYCGKNDKGVSIILFKLSNFIVENLYFN